MHRAFFPYMDVVGVFGSIVIGDILILVATKIPLCSLKMSVLLGPSNGKLDCNHIDSRKPFRPPISVGRPPPDGCYKHNVDGACNKNGIATAGAGADPRFS